MGNGCRKESSLPLSTCTTPLPSRTPSAVAMGFAAFEAIFAMNLLVAIPTEQGIPISVVMRSRMR